MKKAEDQQKLKDEIEKKFESTKDENKNGN